MTSSWGLSLKFTLSVQEWESLDGRAWARLALLSECRGETHSCLQKKLGRVQGFHAESVGLVMSVGTGASVCRGLYRHGAVLASFSLVFVAANTLADTRIHSLTEHLLQRATFARHSHLAEALELLSLDINAQLLAYGNSGGRYMTYHRAVWS